MLQTRSSDFEPGKGARSFLKQFEIEAVICASAAFVELAADKEKPAIAHKAWFWMPAGCRKYESNPHDSKGGGF